VKTNRITPYEAGWLRMLVDRKICTEADAKAAMRRVALEALAEIERLAPRRAKRKRRRKPKE
jgi:hypothetical protein